MNESEVIFIGGRSGVGKSTVAFALHDLLSEQDVRHAVIEGDCLDLAHPAPWKHHLAERNLAAMWENYRELGYRRLIYTNTVSVLEVPALTAAMGDEPEVTSVLLRADQASITERLGQREHGDSLERHIERSTRMATHLERSVSDEVHRIDTEGKTPLDLAKRILALSGWQKTSDPTAG